MESLCDRSDYWTETFATDSNVTFGEFSECVHNSVFWVETAWIWLCAPAYLWYMCKARHKGQPLPVSWLYNAKLAITVLQLAICTAELIARAGVVDQREETYLQPYVLDPLTETATLLLVMLLVEADRRRGVITSAVLTIYWGLANLTHVIPLYFMVSRADYDPGTSQFDLFRAQYVLSLAQLVVCCFAEKLPPVEGKQPCPESRCSFLSQLTFSWINALMALGYQRPLTEKDMFHLNERDKSKVAVPKFEARWKLEEGRLRKNVASINETCNNTDTTCRPLLDDDTRSGAKAKYDDATNDKGERVGVSLVKVIFFTFAIDFIIGHSWRLVWMFLEFSNPYLLGKFIEVAEDLTTASWKGYLLCFAFLGNLLFQSAIINALINDFCTLSYRIRASLVSAIYKKALTMNNKARAKSTVGEIVNIMSVDIEHIRRSCIWISWEFWATPAKIVISMVMLYYRVGWAMLSGLLVVFIMMPINAGISKKIRALEKTHKDHKDKRIKLMTEVLNGIKILKLYAWDMAFADKVTSIRNEELATKLKQLRLDALSSFSWSITPFGVGLSTFVTYIFMSENHLMDAQTALVSLCLFGKLAGTLNFIPHLVMDFTKAKVSLDRIQDFLHHEDIDTTNVSHETSDDAVSITDGSFSWDSAMGTCLKDINLTVPKGSLVAVVGTVGAGKSSLISAVLGEMQKLQGQVNVSGKIAYVPQQAWIQNATLRDNILFGYPMSSLKYKDIIEGCSLTSDLEVLQAKDMTEIGEKGINLSGGQKQRVSLARAVYVNSDIYLLDDPLSAVDSHVGKHIFEQVIGNKGMLRNKTRILVTHGIKWLPHVDKIVVISGRTISEVGTYTELMEHDGDFAKFMTTYLTTHTVSDSSDSDEEVKDLRKNTMERLRSLQSKCSEEEPEVHNNQHNHVTTQGLDSAVDADSDEVAKRIRNAYRKMRTKSECDVTVPRYQTRTISRSLSCEEHIESTQAGSMANGPTLLRSISTHKHDETILEEINNNDVKMVDEEELETGEIRSAVVMSYISALGMRLTLFLLCMYGLHHAFEVWSGTWLTAWTSDDELNNLTSLPADSTKRQYLNAYYLKVYAGLGLAQAFMSLLSMTISARVNIRAAEKLHRNMLINILRCPSSFFDATPVGRIVNRFSGDIDTVDSQLPNEVKSFFVCIMKFITSLCVILYTTPQFAILVLPVGVLYYFIQRNLLPTKRQLRRLEQKTRSPIYNNFSESLNGVGVIRAYGVQERFATETHERVDRNQECLLCNMILDRWMEIRLYSLGALMVFTTAIFAMYNRENLGSALVGLALNYALEIDGKMNWFLHVVAGLQHSFVNVERIEQYSTKKTEAALKTDHEPSSDWPRDGHVEMKSYSVRYREGLNLVLKNIDLSVKPGEKIGIVGRTGAGKSSLTLSLFRLLEPAAGSISIDGEDVCGLGLHDLRSRLTILPQDPVLFSGTLRMNLDPMDKHTDDTILTALGHAHLRTFVESLPGQLAYECGEGGQNLSVGQRQLICLARSLLKKSKVLVLDEATAAVDMETDELIQRTIRTEFKDSTVLTIAHRLNTVMDYDRILVLGHGEVQEFDTPKALLDDAQSVFYGLAKDAGLVK